MFFGRTRTLSDEQRSEQSERARKTQKDPHRPLCGCWHAGNDRRSCPLGLFWRAVGHASSEGKGAAAGSILPADRNGAAINGSTA